jgi:hypothetical protein
MAKERNYRAEYQKRKLRKLRTSGKPEAKFAYVVQRVRAGQSVTAARREVGLSHSAFKRQNEKQQVFEVAEKRRPGKRSYTPKVYRLSIIDAAGVFREAVPFAGNGAKPVFAYFDAVEKAERTGDGKYLKPYRNKTFIDADGNRIKPAADLKVILHRRKTLTAEQSERVTSKFYEIERLGV